MTTLFRGLDYYNASMPQETDDGRLCDEYGDPYPDAVQALRAVVLPTVDKSADSLIREAARAIKRAERTRPVSYGCMHCRDGKDLPEGYVCRRCGADNLRH